MKRGLYTELALKNTKKNLKTSSIKTNSMLNFSAKFGCEGTKDQQGRVFQILCIIKSDRVTTMTRLKNTIQSKLLDPRLNVSKCLAVTLEQVSFRCSSSIWHHERSVHAKFGVVMGLETHPVFKRTGDRFISVAKFLGEASFNFV